jgi:hypothetical protein
MTNERDTNSPGRPTTIVTFGASGDLARRKLHLRFNELDDPQPIPPDTDNASVIESDVPIVVQHTRLDSRQAENALLSTVAYASND